MPSSVGRLERYPVDSEDTASVWVYFLRLSIKKLFTMFRTNGDV